MAGRDVDTATYMLNLEPDRQQRTTSVLRSEDGARFPVHRELVEVFSAVISNAGDVCNLTVPGPSTPQQVWQALRSDVRSQQSENLLKVEPLAC